MKLAPAAVLALMLALTACGGSDGTSAAAPPPAGTAAGGTTAAAAPTTDAAATDSSCTDAPLAGKAALAGTVATDVTVTDGCATLTINTTLPVDPGDGEIARSLCDKAAGEVYQLGVAGISVLAADKTELAVGIPDAACRASI